MKGLEQVSKESQRCDSRKPSTWLPIFYDVKTDTVNTSENGFKVTELINPNEPKDIEEAVKRFLLM